MSFEIHIGFVTMYHDGPVPHQRPTRRVDIGTLPDTPIWLSPGIGSCG